MNEGKRRFTIIGPTVKETPSILPPEGSAEREQLGEQYQQIKQTIASAREKLRTEELTPKKYFAALADLIEQVAELGFVYEAQELRSKSQQMIDALPFEGISSGRVCDIQDNYYYAAVKSACQFGSATEALKNLHRIKDEFLRAQAYIEMGEALTKQQSSPDMIKSFFEKADKLLVESSSDKDVDIDAYRASLCLLAVAQAKAGFFDEARELADKITDQTLKNKIFKEIGLRQVADGDLQDALDTIKYGINDQKEGSVPTADVLLASAERLIAEGQPKAAADFIEEVSKITPAYAFPYWCAAYCRIAKMRADLDQSEEAEKCLERAHIMADKMQLKSRYQQTLMLCRIIETKKEINQLTDQDWESVKATMRDESIVGDKDVVDRLLRLNALASTANRIDRRVEAVELLDQADAMVTNAIIVDPPSYSEPIKTAIKVASATNVIKLDPSITSEQKTTPRAAHGSAKNIKLNSSVRLKLITAQMKVASARAEIFGLTPDKVKAYESEQNRQDT